MSTNQHKAFSNNGVKDAHYLILETKERTIKIFYYINHTLSHALPL